MGVYLCGTLDIDLLGSTFAVKQKVDHSALNLLLPQHLLASFEQPAVFLQLRTAQQQGACLDRSPDVSLPWAMAAQWGRNSTSLYASCHELPSLDENPHQPP